jgi:type IV fimbrial biogenesis protein FimT
MARSHRGFTLIELMVTISIVAILSTLAAPSFRRLIAQQRVKAATFALSESLWIARSEALKRNNDVTFTFTTAASGWDVTPVGLPATKLMTQEGIPAVSSTILSGGGVFTFNQFGRLSSGAGQIEFANAGANVTRCVTISSSGRTTMKDTAC